MPELVFDIKKLSCKKVTVYSDLAEVKRTFEADLKEGQNEIIVSGITDRVARESFRVDGRGDATVCDVQFQVIPAKRDDTWADKEKDLNEQMKILEDHMKEIVSERKRLEMRQKMWAKAMERVKNGGDDQNGKGQLIIDSADVLTEFVKTMDKEQCDIDSKMMELDKKLLNSDEEINVLRRKLNAQRGVQNEIRQLSILLEAQKSSKVEIDISYIVYDASWTPDYDIRVFTEGANKTLKVSYSGLIRQCTGEDWNEAKVELSTSKPSIGGQVPEPKPLKAEFYRSPPPPLHPIDLSFKQVPASFFACSLPYHRRASSRSEMDTPIMQRLTVKQLPVKENLMSATFEIARATTIPSDNSAHKVSICQVDFAPKFTYKCSPKHKEYVYLIGKIVNNSRYVFLPGKAMVFVNGNFLTKTEMKSVSPGEEFKCSLGADPVIRVSYRPIKKYAGETGLISKNTVTQYEQRIEFKNTKQEPIKVDLVEPIPLTTDEKLKVTLIKPEGVEATKGKNSTEPYFDKDHLLHMTVALAKGEEKCVEIKYKVEHPVGENVTFKEI